MWKWKLFQFCLMVWIWAHLWTFAQSPEPVFQRMGFNGSPRRNALSILADSVFRHRTIGLVYRPAAPIAISVAALAE